MAESSVKALRLVLEIAKARSSLIEEHKLEEIQTDDMTENAFLQKLTVKRHLKAEIKSAEASDDS